MRKTSIRFLEYEKEIYQRLSENYILILKKIKESGLIEFTIREAASILEYKISTTSKIFLDLYTSLILDKEEDIILSEKNNRKYFVDKYKINLFTKKIFEVLE